MVEKAYCMNGGGSDGSEEGDVCYRRTARVVRLCSSRQNLRWRAGKTDSLPRKPRICFQAGRHRQSPGALESGSFEETEGDYLPFVAVVPKAVKRLIKPEGLRMEKLGLYPALQKFVGTRAL